MITELDGPPTAYFEIFDAITRDEAHIGRQQAMIRIIYRTLIASTPEKLESALSAIRERLDKDAPDQGILWWRLRPKTSMPGGVRAGPPQTRCRLATSPPLDHAFWLSIATPDNLEMGQPDWHVGQPSWRVRNLMR